VSATWNNAGAPVDENEFQALYAAVLGARSGMK
jgi:hypothetical protein